MDSSAGMSELRGERGAGGDWVVVEDPCSWHCKRCPSSLDAARPGSKKGASQVLSQWTYFASGSRAEESRNTARANSAWGLVPYVTGKATSHGVHVSPATVNTHVTCGGRAPGAGGGGATQPDCRKYSMLPFCGGALVVLVLVVLVLRYTGKRRGRGEGPF